ncbi:MAG: DEAD/DEAH box helicase, partial [Candidatus Hydrogenedentes bacterium]|nr:DEAD/DEAH box helicase [Candidatus Hydrogenedentota bacterium]
MDVHREGNELVIRFDYRPDTIKTLKTLPERKWNKRKSCWLVPAEDLLELHRLFPNARYVGLKKDFERLIDKKKKKSMRLVPALKMGIELRGYQQAAVDHLANKDGALFADEMGLGKTFEGIAWANQHRARGGQGPILVVCPPMVRRNCAREIRRCFPHEAIVVVDGKTSSNVQGQLLTGFNFAKWVVINYDKIWRPKVFETIMGCTRPTVVLLDEAHYIKNEEASRTKAAIQICEEVDFIAALTGTPILNRPVELFTILRALKKKRKSESWDFRQRYCGAKNNGFGWDFSGASHLDELSEYLKPFMARNYKKDVLKELPPKIHTAREVEIGNLAEYYAAEREYEDGESMMNTLALFNRLKVLTAEGKVGGTVEYMKELQECGKKAIVFCSYKAPLYSIRKEFPKACVMITGDEDTQSRELAIHRFQTNKYVRFALCTYAAGGVGLNLQAAEQVVLEDLPWTPALKSQAEDRAHRIGQTKGLVVCTMVAPNTLDPHLLEVL